MQDDKPIDRRKFFRQGLRELLRPLAGAVQPLEEVAKQLGRMEDAFPVPKAAQPAKQIMPQQFWLRPPGSLEERSFRDTCSRCAKCVDVCPAQCIKIDSTGIKGHGAPYIEPEVMPCVVCDGLLCMRECPSGALVPTAIGMIHMGTAVWNEAQCVRSNGEDCKICVTDCPLGSVAIELKDNRIRVIEAGCIGCGVCQNHCPTNPKSITVVPRAAGDVYHPS